ncbi:MAG: phage tail tube protein [Clostridia bacterium]|nr:phage tail tube protein [Clostridia bacterium]
MKAKNAISGHSGIVTLEINKKLYELGNLKKFEAKLSIDSSEIKICGSNIVKHKAGMISGDYSATIEYNMPQLRAAITEYKKTGNFPDVNIIVENDEATSDVKGQKIKFYNCIPSELLLALLDAESNELTEDFSGTFDDYEILKSFKEVKDVAKKLN